MKRVSWILVVIFLCLLIPTQTEARPRNNNQNDLKRIIVVFEGEIDASLADKYGGEFIRESKRLNAGIFLLPEAVIEEIKNEPGVIEIRIEEPVLKVLPSFIKPLMPRWKRWFLIRKLRRRYIKNLIGDYRNGEITKTEFRQGIIGWGEALEDGIRILEGEPTPYWNLQEAGINAVDAWNDYSLNGDEVIIAFLDTGVDYEIPDLDANYLGGDDFVNPDSNPMDDNGHGTRVASVALAEGELKLVGAAPQAKYYALKVIDENGDGYPSDTIDAIQWAIDHNSVPGNDHIDIISMSFGTDDLGGNYDDTKEICEDAYNAGIILVAGSGNDGDVDPLYPAAFDTVICAGGHSENQEIWDDIHGASNGGCDIVAPADEVVAVSMRETGYPDGRLYMCWGTSHATPHVSAIIALALQYARANNIEINNGYQWEMVKHSAIDLEFAELWQGKGKARAKESIDLIAGEWPLEYDFAYSNYLYFDGNGLPVYFIGTSMYQDVTLTNNTDTVGNYPSDIEELNVTTTQTYYQHSGEVNMPGSPIEVFPTKAIDAGDLPEILEDTYYLPWSTIPGDSRTILDMEFEFIGDANDRLIKVTYPYASLWCPPPAVNEGFPIED